MYYKRVAYDIIDSTHTMAKRYAKHFTGGSQVWSAGGYMLITAEAQTDGIGQYRRKWVSPPGNLYATLLLLWPKNAQHTLMHITQVTSMAIAEVLAQLGCYAKIKGVNDLCIDQKKICGVLSEKCDGPSHWTYDWLLVSFGVNVYMGKNDGILEIDQPSTSLSLEGKKVENKEQLLAQIHPHILMHLNRLLVNGFDIFSDQWHKNR